VEAAVILLFLLTAGFVAFGSGPEVARYPALLLLVFPPLLWAAVRLGPLGASTALLGVAALSVWGTAGQLGPFVLFSDATRVLSLQLFWITMSTPILLLAAVIRKREQAEITLLTLRQHLAREAGGRRELSGRWRRAPPTAEAIRANAEAASTLLDRGDADPGQLRAILEDIAQQNRYAADVITRMRSFLQEREPRFEQLVLETVVQDALALTRGLLDRLGVVVNTDVGNGLPRVWGDSVQLVQVVLNLILNGCESMTHTPVAERVLRLQLARNDGQYVELAIEDRVDGLPLGAEERM
jgi:signal transduction histidine kinase